MTEHPRLTKLQAARVEETDPLTKLQAARAAEAHAAEGFTYVLSSVTDSGALSSSNAVIGIFPSLDAAQRAVDEAAAAAQQDKKGDDATQGTATTEDGGDVSDSETGYSATELVLDTEMLMIVRIREGIIAYAEKVCTRDDVTEPWRYAIKSEGELKAQQEVRVRASGKRTRVDAPPQQDEEEKSCVIDPIAAMEDANGQGRDMSKRERVSQ